MYAMVIGEWISLLSLLTMILGLGIGLLRVWVKLNIAVNENKTRIMELEFKHNKLEIDLKRKAESIDIDKLRADLDSRMSLIHTDIRDVRSLLIIHLDKVSSNTNKG